MTMEKASERSLVMKVKNGVKVKIAAEIGQWWAGCSATKGAL
jgi:hypothetical protein